MTYRVQWIQSALDELSELWMDADSTERATITNAVYALDRQLQRDPFAVSESRDPGEWICFADPLGALVEIDAINRRMGIVGLEVSLSGGVVEDAAENGGEAPWVACRLVMEIRRGNSDWSSPIPTLRRFFLTPSDGLTNPIRSRSTVRTPACRRN